MAFFPSQVMLVTEKTELESHSVWMTAFMTG